MIRTVLYGLKNEHEFVAEAFNNPTFRDWLKSREARSTGSKIGDMWTGVKNAVFKMLRMPERVRSAFDQVMEQMPALMKKKRRYSLRRVTLPAGWQVNSHLRRASKDDNIKDGLSGSG